MMSTRLLIAAATALLVTGSASYGQTTITGSYSATDTGAAGYVPNLSAVGLKSPFTENLTVGGGMTTPTTFLQVAPIGGSQGVGTKTGTVSVAFTLTAPTSSSVTGVTYSGDAATLSGGVITVAANYELFYGTNPQTDCLTWNAATCTSTGNTTTIGDTLVVTFADNAVLDVNLYNWSDWNMTPNISFQLVTAPSTGGPATPAPEPASIALFGTAFAGFSLIRRRRTGVKSSATR